MASMKLLPVLLLWAATAAAAPSRFTSPVPYEPLVAKLKASGGSRSRIVQVSTARDLTRLESGKRYKFVVDETGGLLVAPLPAEAPNNEYVHPILANGAPVRTAGGITVEHAAGKITRIVLDQDSKAYCPTWESLDQAAEALEKAGLARAVIARQNRPPVCAERTPGAAK
jgi:hypothetical protein